jgi:hypothetical protein
MPIWSRSFQIAVPSPGIPALGIPLSLDAVRRTAVQQKPDMSPPSPTQSLRISRVSLPYQARVPLLPTTASQMHQRSKRRIRPQRSGQSRQYVEICATTPSKTQLPRRRHLSGAEGDLPDEVMRGCTISPSADESLRRLSHGQGHHPSVRGPHQRAAPAPRDRHSRARRLALRKQRRQRSPSSQV